MSTEPSNTSSLIQPVPTSLSNIQNDEKLFSKDSLIKIANSSKYVTKNNFQICFNCPVEDCTMLFKTEEEVEKHKKDHKNLVYCSFENCNKSFRDIINLKKHYKTHFTKQKIHCCPYPGCGKKFTESYNLTIHYRHHTGDKPYSCEKCGKRFYDRTNYKYHVNVKHIKIEVKDTICQHKGCNRKSKTSKQKLMHHNILEPECKSEKNQLLNVLLSFQRAINEVLGGGREERKEKNGEKGEKKEGGMKENVYDFKGGEKELKKEIENIDKQSKVLMKLIVDKDQYKGIIDNI